MPNSNRKYPLVDQFPVLHFPHVGALLSMDGVIEEVNAYGEEFFQYPYDELVGMNFAELTHPHWLSIDSALFKKLRDDEITDYTIPRKSWIDSYGKEITGRLFAAKCYINGTPKVYGGVTPYIESHPTMPYLSAPDYTAFGLPGQFWRGVSALIKQIDVWKLLVVVSGIVIALYLLRDVLPQIWGG